jgi:hypothetical protein
MVLVTDIMSERHRDHVVAMSDKNLESTSEMM